MARYGAEHIHRAKNGSGTAALIGTAVHGGLESYVQAVYIDKIAGPDWDLLKSHYDHSYRVTFSTTDLGGDEYEDGLEMTRTWFDRTDLSNVEVLSVEQKYTFKVVVPDDAGEPIELPFNYVWDRFERILDQEDAYRVVDYKTIRWGFSPSELKGKTQARMYGLAAQIRYPNAKVIWVEFDLLRHERVAVRFTKEENAASWLWLKSKIKAIIDADVANLPETINPECKWCPRKAACTALAAQEKVKGTLSMETEELIDRRAKAKMQMDALKSLMEEVDAIIEHRAKKEDVMEFSSSSTRAYFARSKRRVADADRVEQIIGPELFDQWGKKDITIGNVDKLLKGSQLTPEQKIQLKGVIADRYGDPYLKTEPAKV